MTLKRDEWQGIVRDVDWTLRYVDDEAVYPDWLSGSGKVPREAWSKWEESYKVAYPEYVATQNEKEVSAYAVKNALRRSNQFDGLSEAWKSSVKMHLGGIALVEYAAVYGESRMARFGLSPAWRNMAVMGILDEIRHGQLSLSVGHEMVADDPQFDWAHRALLTNDWVSIALRALIDNMMIGGSVVDIAIQLPFTFETGFTNIQFVALAADALEVGDVNFANMISSIQTDEARHSQQGGPTLEILVEHDPVRAQWTVDKFFWLSARAFSALTGPSMDYNTPVEHRKQSYREFMEEWIIDQFVRTIQDYGLKKPWYWDEFMEGLDVWHHIPADGRMVLAAHIVVEAGGGGRRIPRVADGEVSQLGHPLRRQVAGDRRKRQQRQNGAGPARNPALAVQLLHAPHLQRHLREGRQMAGAQLLAQAQRRDLPFLH